MLYTSSQSEVEAALITVLPGIPPSSTREEIRDFARTEFERYREVHDLVSLPYLGLRSPDLANTNGRVISDISSQ